MSSIQTDVTMIFDEELPTATAEYDSWYKWPAKLKVQCKSGIAAVRFDLPPDNPTPWHIEQLENLPGDKALMHVDVSEHLRDDAPVKVTIVGCNGKETVVPDIRELFLNLRPRKVAKFELERPPTASAFYLEDGKPAMKITCIAGLQRITVSGAIVNDFDIPGQQSLIWTNLDYRSEAKPLKVRIVGRNGKISAIPDVAKMFKVIPSYDPDPNMPKVQFKLSNNGAEMVDISCKGGISHTVWEGPYADGNKANYTDMPYNGQSHSLRADSRNVGMKLTVTSLTGKELVIPNVFEPFKTIPGAYPHICPKTYPPSPEEGESFIQVTCEHGSPELWVHCPDGIASVVCSGVYQPTEDLARKGFPVFDGGKKMSVPIAQFNRAALLGMTVADMGGRTTACPNVWDLFPLTGLVGAVESDVPALRQRRCIPYQVEELQVPNSDIVLHRYSTTSLLINQGPESRYSGCDDDLKWAVPLCRVDEEGCIRKAEMIDVQLGPDMLIVVHYTPKISKPCGPRYDCDDHRLKAPGASHKLPLITKREVTSIQVCCEGRDKPTSILVRAGSISAGKGREEGELDTDEEDARKNKKRRQLRRRIKHRPTDRRRRLHNLEPEDGWKIVGFYGNSDSRGYISDLGIITAPRGVELPVHAYCMPELDSQPSLSEYDKLRKWDSSVVPVAERQEADRHEAEDAAAQTATSSPSARAQAWKSLPPDHPDRMEVATERFRDRMLFNNSTFMREIADKIRTFGLPDSHAQLDYLARFYKKGSHGWTPPPMASLRYVSEKRRKAVQLEHDVRTLEDALALPLISTDGTAAEDQRWTPRHARLFIEELADHAFGVDDSDAVAVPASQRLATELEAFLTIAGGISDPDFRRSGICGFGADIRFRILGINNGKANTGQGAQGLNEETEETALRQKMRAFFELQSYEMWVKTENWSTDVLDCDLKVLYGFKAGEEEWTNLRDQPERRREWYVWFCFCRPVSAAEITHGVEGEFGSKEKKVQGQREVDNEIERMQREETNVFDERDGWAWRVVLYRRERESHTGPDVFDSVVEFMEWYAEWPARMDDEPNDVKEMLSEDSDASLSDFGDEDDDEDESAETDGSIDI